MRMARFDDLMKCAWISTLILILGDQGRAAYAAIISLLGVSLSLHKKLINWLTVIVPAMSRPLITISLFDVIRLLRSLQLITRNDISLSLCCLTVERYSCALGN